MSRKRKSKQSGQVGRLENIPILNPDAAGMDIGADEIYVAVPADRDEWPVQCFGTFTGELPLGQIIKRVFKGFLERECR